MSAPITCRLPPQLERLTFAGVEHAYSESEDGSPSEPQWPPTLQRCALDHWDLEVLVKVAAHLPKDCTVSHKQTVLLGDRQVPRDRWPALEKLQGRFKSLQVELDRLAPAKAAVLAACMKAAGGETDPTLSIM
jgi:hypothetical protein